MCVSSGFVQTEGSSDVESIKDITFIPCAYILPDKLLFDHSTGIREVELEHVSTRLNVYSERERIAVGIRNASSSSAIIVVLILL